jgi:allophanate hydrolase-like protein
MNELKKKEQKTMARTTTFGILASAIISSIVATALSSASYQSAFAQADECVELAVNGTLMRGLELEPNLVNLGATFVRENQTEPAYRLFSINDVHPAMVRVPAAGFENETGVSVAVEIWCVPPAGLGTLLGREPPGLSIGKVTLADGETIVLGVIAEPALLVGMRDISNFTTDDAAANWRVYIASEGMRFIDEALAEGNLTDQQEQVVQTYRTAGELLFNNGQYRGAIDVLNHAVKMLDIDERLYLNIPLGYTAP